MHHSSVGPNGRIGDSMVRVIIIIINLARGGKNGIISLGKPCFVSRRLRPDACHHRHETRLQSLENTRRHDVFNFTRSGNRRLVYSSLSLSFSFSPSLNRRDQMSVLACGRIDPAKRRSSRSKEEMGRKPPSRDAFNIQPEGERKWKRKRDDRHRAP